jgi:hypothetical protein
VRITRLFAWIPKDFPLVAILNYKKLGLVKLNFFFEVMSMLP